MLALDGSSLRAGDIARVAAGGETVRVTSLARATAAQAYADQAAARRPVYGRSTGVGGNRLIPLDDALTGVGNDPALALLRSHARRSARCAHRNAFGRRSWSGSTSWPPGAAGSIRS